TKSFTLTYIDERQFTTLRSKITQRSICQSNIGLITLDDEIRQAMFQHNRCAFFEQPPRVAGLLAPLTLALGMAEVRLTSEGIAQPSDQTKISVGNDQGKHIHGLLCALIRLCTRNHDRAFA